jgi:hypothetical protein
MAEKTYANLKAVLQRRAAEFLAAEAAHRNPLKPLLQEIGRLGQKAYLFGGTLRDLMLHGLSHDPHDVDIVVAKLTPDLLSYLRPYVRRKTRFGGLEVSIGHWDLDIWELSDTWAFREGLVPGGSFGDLPKTTFLNVQAIAAEVPSSNGATVRLAEHGFFRAIRHRTVDINFEDNPFPSRCVLSALTTAYSLDFALAPKLIQYVLHYGAKVDLEELCLYQARRHGRCLYGRDVLHAWITHLAKSRREAPSMPVALPRHRAQQHSLPWSQRDILPRRGSSEAMQDDETTTPTQQGPQTQDCRQKSLF